MFSIRTLLEADDLERYITKETDFSELIKKLNQKISKVEEQIPRAHTWLVREIKKSDLEMLDNHNQIENEYNEKMDRILTELEELRTLKYNINILFDRLTN